MSKNKGLSPEEKAAKLLGWFHTTKEFYSQKEIEKEGVKATGISGMVIKDILKLLTDDGLVLSEKVGTSNYFWSFPGAAAAKVKAEHAASQSELKTATQRLQEAKDYFETLKADRGCGEDDSQEARQSLLAEYYTQKNELDSIKAKLSNFAAGDPALYEEKKRDIELMKESALRWTDQISSLMSYLRDIGCGEPADFVQMLELPEDWEELSFD